MCAHFYARSQKVYNLSTIFHIISRLSDLRRKWAHRKHGRLQKKPPIYVVIPNQSADWCGNPPDRSKSHWFRI